MVRILHGHSTPRGVTLPAPPRYNPISFFITSATGRVAFSVPVHAISSLWKFVLLVAAVNPCVHVDAMPRRKMSPKILCRIGFQKKIKTKNTNSIRV